MNEARQRSSIEHRFEEFNARNPHVYQRLRALALQAVGRGHRRIGMKMLWEVLRWQEFLETVPDGDGWKLNNDFTSYYARLLMAREPALAGVFETRQLRAEREQFDVVSDFDRRQRLPVEIVRQDALERVAPAPLASAPQPADQDRDGGQLFTLPTPPPASGFDPLGPPEAA